MVNKITAIKANAGECFALAVVHHLPGRLRLRSAALKGDVQSINRCRIQVGKINGIISAKPNPNTGSFLLKYDPAVIPANKIAEVLAACSITVSRPPEDIDNQPRSCDAILSLLERLVLEVLADRVMLAIVGAAL
jgi:hypothetical protein